MALDLLVVHGMAPDPAYLSSAGVGHAMPCHAMPSHPIMTLGGTNAVRRQRSLTLRGLTWGFERG